MSDMDKHKKRLEALAAKAQSGTEAEMAEALKMMFDYANKHGLDVNEVGKKDASEFVDSDPIFSGRAGHFDLADLHGIRVIQTFAGVLHRIHQTKEENSIIFFGDPVAVEFATWLRMSIGRRVGGMWQTHKYKLIGDNGGYKNLNLGNEMKAFYQEAYARIGERMSFIIKDFEKKTGSTDLVVNREAELREALAARGIKLHRHAHGSVGHSARSAAAGRVAGDMVDLGRPLAGGRIAIGSK